MASNLRVDTILPSTGTTLGIGTASGTINFLGNSNITTTGTISAASLSVTGSLGIGGTLTYEDVTNVDSVGIITARSGIRVTSTTAGIAVGTNAMVSGRADNVLHLHKASGGTADGPTIYFTNQQTGVSGNDGLTIGLNDTQSPYIWNRENTATRFGTNNAERLRIGPAGQIGLSGANYGSSGQVLTSQGSSSAASWSTIASGLFSSYAIICDGNKSSGTNGGQPANTSSYLKRDLNTEIADPDGIVSLSSNQFTLQAGSYYIHAAAPGHRMNQHQARLYNATDGAVVQYGMSAHSSDGNSGNSIAHVYARVTISGAKAFEIQHRCSNTDGEGFGLANSFGNNQIYTLVEIFKEN